MAEYFYLNDDLEKYSAIFLQYKIFSNTLFSNLLRHACFRVEQRNLCLAQGLLITAFVIFNKYQLSTAEKK